MPFETTDIAAKTNSQPFDAVKTMSGLADLNNAQNQNKFFQAKNLAGQYLEHSLGPDGQPDFEKLGQFLVIDKRTGPFATELMQAAKSFQNTGASTQSILAGTRRTNVATEQDLQALAAARYKAAQGIAVSAGNTSTVPIDIDPKTGIDRNQAKRNKENSFNAVTALANAMGTKMFDPDAIAQVLGDGSFMPTAIRAGALSGAGGAGSYNAAVPQVQAVDVGPNVKMVGVNPALGGANTIGGNSAILDKGLNPEEENTGAYTSIDPTTNQPTVITKSVAAKSPPKGPVVTGLAPGVMAAAEVAASKSADQFKAAQLDSTSAQGRMLMLKNSLQSLESTTTGPGTKEVNSIKSFLLAQGGELALLLPGIDPKTIASWDEAHKYMNAYTLNRANSLGPLTGDKLAAAVSANANTDISKLAAKDMLKVNIGLERMQMAGLAAFQATHRPPENYSDFMSNWSRQVDPRAFMLDQLTGKERAEMTKKMTSTEITQFQNGVRDAVQLGIYGRKDWPK